MGKGTGMCPFSKVGNWKRGVWLCSWAGLRGPTGLRLDQKWMLESRGLGVSNRPDGVCINKTQNEMSEDKYTKMKH